MQNQLQGLYMYLCSCS